MTDETLPTIESRLDRLRDQFDSGLSQHLQGVRRVALLDFPDYDNVGDSAIWLGQVQSLRRLGIRVVYAASRRSFRADAVRALPPDVAVLITGGGNFGDLWPHHQEFRESVAAQFPQRRFVQLPQTVHFRDEDVSRRSAELLRSHPDLTVLVRDRESERYVRDVMGLSVGVVPDAALAIDRSTLGPRPPAEREVLALWRRDAESGAPAEPAPAVDSVDWTGGGRSAQVRWFRRRVRALTEARRVPGAAALTTALLDRRARAEVQRGVRLLARGQVVATDRLHAVVLASLLGIPNVAVENSYGKVGRVHGLWLADSPLTRFAPDRAAALETAQAWARQAR